MVYENLLKLPGRSNKLKLQTPVHTSSNSYLQAVRKARS